MSQFTGHPAAFAGAAGIVVVWAVLGPVFHFSDTWQLVINTGTTIITFLMVFVIQNTQNRDTEAMQLKLDELIRTMQGAHNALLDLEELSSEDLDRIRKPYEALAREAREALRGGEARPPAARPRPCRPTVPAPDRRPLPSGNGARRPRRATRSASRPEERRLHRLPGGGAGARARRGPPSTA